MKQKFNPTKYTFEEKTTINKSLKSTFLEEKNFFKSILEAFYVLV